MSIREARLIVGIVLFFCGFMLRHAIQPKPSAAIAGGKNDSIPAAYPGVIEQSGPEVRISDKPTLVISNAKHIGSCGVKNESTVPVDVLMTDGKDGVSIFVLPAPSGVPSGGVRVKFPVPLEVSTGNLYAKGSIAGASVTVSCARLIRAVPQ